MRLTLLISHSYTAVKGHKITLLIFFCAFLLYLINLPIDYSKSIETNVPRRLLTSNDVTSATFIPYEILKNNTLYFSEDTVNAMRRAQAYDQDVYSVLQSKSNGNTFSSMPVLAGIMGIPIYLLPILLNKIPSLHYYENLVNILTLGRIAASFYTAISTAIFFLILKEINKLQKFSTDMWTFLFLIFFAFGTNVYAIASRSLYQHTSSLLFVTVTVLLMLKSIDNEKYVKYLGILVGLLYLARPLNVVFVAIMTAYVFFYHKKQFTKYLLFALPVALLLFAYNYHAWGNPITTEYVVKGDTKFSTPLLYGISGYLFSPSRSFLFISPPLAMCYYAMLRLFKISKKSGVDVVLIVLSVTFLVFLCLYSMWHDWGGGDRFGYGFLTEWVPIAAILSYTVTKNFRKWGKVIIFILILWSIFVQVNAVWVRKSRCAHDWSFYCLKPGFFERQEY